MATLSPKFASKRADGGSAIYHGRYMAGMAFRVDANPVAATVGSAQAAPPWVVLPAVLR